MNIRHILTVASLTLALFSMASAQTDPSKQINSSYVESCIQKQAQLHQNLKEISPDHFRFYCTCTATQLMNNLSSAQLDELSKGNKIPKQFKSAEDSASKACLKPISTTQV
jgi:hypothetical protein